MFGKKRAASYAVNRSKQADNYYQKAGSKLQRQFDKKISVLCKDPWAGYPLSGELNGFYAYESGKFRIEYVINPLKGTVDVVRIGPRGDVYKK